MNVRALREEEKIRKIDFGEHILGFKYGLSPTDEHLYRPFQYSSNVQRYKLDDNPQNKMLEKHIKTTSGKRISQDRANYQLDRSREMEHN